MDPEAKAEMEMELAVIAQMKLEEEKAEMEISEGELETRAEMETESEVEWERYLTLSQYQYFKSPKAAAAAAKDKQEERPQVKVEVDEDEDEDEDGSPSLYKFVPLPQPPNALHPLSTEIRTIEDDEIWSFLDPFSEATMNRFIARLFGDEERLTTKLVYLCLTRREYSGFSSSWMVVDANRLFTVGPKRRRVVSVSSLDDDMRNPNPNFDLSSLSGYGCAVWGSKICIAGGTCKGVPSNNVFIYDIDRRVWDTNVLRMNVRRGENPTVVTANDMIFIFGGCPSDDAGAWGEVYDPAAAAVAAASISCQCLPPIPGTKIFNSEQIVSSKIISHAVHSNGNKIYLWLDAGFVLAYNYLSRSWRKYENDEPITKLPQLNSKVVVFEDILFWHSHGSIFAHDLLDSKTVLMYTLRRAGFSKVLFDDKIVPSFLAHVGKGKLCLFFRSGYHICYFTLLIQLNQLPGISIPFTVPGDSGILQNTLNCDIMHALDFSS